MIKSAELRSLIERLQTLQKDEDEWINSIPKEIRDAFFDNPLLNNVLLERDVVLKFALGDLYEDVYWFLNDWSPGYSIHSDDAEYIIEDINDYFNYLEVENLVEK